MPKPTLDIAFPKTPAAAGLHPFSLACPRCGSALEAAAPDALHCPLERHLYRCVDGVWRLLPPERARYFSRFIADYTAIRRAEGRGSDDPSYYRALPFADRSGRFRRDWRIRARSYRALVDRVVQPLEAGGNRPLRILDLGAGNGWLSYRLAQRGHHVAAVDLQDSPHDGLGAHAHYDAFFLPVQAEFDRLPFAGGQFDLVLFNASFHYATDYAVTLREALRVLRAEGRLAILDTPVYRDGRSGAQMVRERTAHFERTYGCPSNALPCEHYLTERRLRHLAASLGITWHTYAPFYGWRWALRPWLARLLRRREPARFLLLVGRRAPCSGPALPPPLLRAGWRLLLRWRFRLFQRHRYGRLVVEHVAGKPLVVLPRVFNPKLFRTGAFLAETLDARLIRPGARVLDMGTGTGIGALVAAQWAASVDAVDISPEAVRCARINVLLNRADEKVAVHEGDLFEPVQGSRYDAVLFNPPYFRGTPRGALDRAWRSEDVVERFVAGLRAHLKPEGCALVVLSSDGESEAFLHAFRLHGFTPEVVSEKVLINEVLVLYRLSTAADRSTHLLEAEG